MYLTNTIKRLTFFAVENLSPISLRSQRVILLIVYVSENYMGCLFSSDNDLKSLRDALSRTGTVGQEQHISVGPNVLLINFNKAFCSSGFLQFAVAEKTSGGSS